jgi:hypothetical protein
VTKALGSTGHLFARKTPAKTFPRTHQREHRGGPQAFELAGGLIERLGNTSTLKHIPAVEAAHASPRVLPARRNPPHRDRNRGAIMSASTDTPASANCANSISA